MLLDDTLGSLEYKPIIIPCFQPHLSQLIDNLFSIIYTFQSFLVWITHLYFILDILARSLLTPWISTPLISEDY